MHPHRDRRELPIPPDAIEAAQAIELLRAWAIDGALQCSLLPTAWDDTRAWGLMLADVARQVANAIQEQSGTPADETLDAIVAGFRAEITWPTDEPTGSFVDHQ